MDTDVYFFRIVDQMAQMNHETLVNQGESSPYLLSIVKESSDILKKEMKWYQNTIFSDDQDDIA
jgi:hypothetical protein